MRTRRNRRKRFLKILLPVIIPLVVCLSLLALPFRFSNHIKTTLSRPLVPLQKAFLTAGDAVKKAFLWIPQSWRASDEVRDLEEEVFLLENMVVVQKATIDRLRTKLTSVTEYYGEGSLDQRPLLANVVAYDTSDLRKSVLIDVGSQHGVTENSVVIADAALMGRVSAVGKSTSRVLLITDPASKVPARILETDDVGIVEGGSGDICRLKYLSRWGQKVEKGYKVVSSPIGGVFPDALFIATVSEDVEDESSSYKTLRLRPRVDPGGVSTVMVLKR
ncbi:MAG: rod shape-determining protein MreC [Candidatus Brocadiales bacterium]